MIKLTLGKPKLPAGKLRVIATMAALALSTTFTLIGCGKFLESRAPDRSSIVIQDEKLKCLGTLPENLSSWVKTGKPDIDDSIECAVRAIDEFSTRTTGDAPGSWSREALTNFIDTYFTKNHGIMGTDLSVWILEVIRFKVLLLGGAQDHVTAEELHRVRNLLIKARPMLRDLSVNVQTATFTSKDQANGQAETTGKSIEALANLIAEEVEHKKGDDQMVIEIRAIVESVQNLGMKDVDIDSWMPLGKALKAIIVGGEKSVITQKELPTLLREVGHLWALALRVNYDVLNSPDYLGKDLPKLELAISQVLDFLERSVRAQEGDDTPGINVRLLEDLIDALGAKNLIPLKLKVDTTKGMIQPMLVKWLHGNSLGDKGETGRALTLAHLKVLREIAADWIEGQKLLLRTLGDNETMNLEAFAATLAKMPLATRELPADRVRVISRAHSQLVDLYTRGRPIMFTSDHRTIIAPRSRLPNVTRYDIDVANAARAGIAMVLRGYAHDPSLAATTRGVTENEAQEIYFDFRELGKDIGLMDVRNNTAGTRTFMETNIFQSVSNGDTLIDLHEAIEWFGTVLGGGMMADRLHDEAIKECADRNGHVDVLGKQKLDVRCFRDHFKRGFQKNFTNLPGLSKWLKEDQSGARMDQLIVALETAGRTKGFSDRLIDSSEMRALMPILHYTESLFARFDANGDNVLDTNELWAAFPILQPFIRKMANGKAEDEQLQKAIFSYLLTWGKPPAPSLFGGLGVFAWQWGRLTVHETADRLSVLKVMASFAISAKQERARQISEYYKINKNNLRGIILSKQDSEIQKITELFYCLPPAAPLLADLLRAHVNSILPADHSVDVKDFFSRTDELIDGDAKLEIYCMPF